MRYQNPTFNKEAYWRRRNNIEEVRVGPPPMGINVKDTRPKFKIRRPLRGQTYGGALGFISQPLQHIPQGPEFTKGLSKKARLKARREREAAAKRSI